MRATDTSPDDKKLIIVSGASSSMGNMTPFRAKNITDTIMLSFTR